VTGVLQFFFVRIIPPALHASLYVHSALTGRVNGRSLETFQKTMIVRKSDNVGWKSTFALVFEVLKCKIKDIDTAPSDHMPRPAVNTVLLLKCFLDRSVQFRGRALFCDVANSKYAVIASDCQRLLCTACASGNVLCQRCFCTGGQIDSITGRHCASASASDCRCQSRL
jgi:hypothetical protein